MAPAANDIFESAVDYVLRNEGGFVNDPADAGKATNYEITEATLSDWLGREATDDEVRALDLRTAKHIYRVLYWNPLFLYDVTSQPIATCVMDAGVLFGTQASARCAQLALASGYASAPDVDGVMGPETVAALNTVDPSGFVAAFKQALVTRVAQIVAAHPGDQRFRAGWLDRVQRYSALVP